MRQIEKNKCSSQENQTKREKMIQEITMPGIAFKRSKDKDSRGDEPVYQGNLIAS